LSAAQWHSILKTLRKGALKAGFETDRWTLRRIRDLIRRQFGVAYHPNYLAARLRASGWSPQIPAVHAKERDEEVIRAWLDWSSTPRKYSVNPWLRVVTRLSLFGCDEPSSTEPRWIVATTG